MAVLESKQGDVVICEHRVLEFAIPDEPTCRTAQAGGYEVWQSVLTMVKNLSEVMLGSFPNFWKISKGFLEGKYKKVYTALQLFLRRD